MVPDDPPWTTLQNKNTHVSLQKGKSQGDVASAEPVVLIPRNPEGTT